jgi:hypothetical protein
MRSPNQALRRTLVRYAFALACVSTLVVGIVFVTRDRHLTSGSILSAIGLNLIAGVLFAVIFTVLSTRVQERSLEQNIGEKLTELSMELSSEVAKWDRTFLPMSTYPPVDPTDGYGGGFNRDMTYSLEKTGFYAFRGPSPRYVSARLKHTRHIPQQVKVAMLSPGDRRAIARRSSDRRFWERSRGKTLQTLELLCVENLIGYRAGYHSA